MKGCSEDLWFAQGDTDRKQSLMSPLGGIK